MESKRAQTYMHGSGHGASQRAHVAPPVIWAGGRAVGSRAIPWFPRPGLDPALGSEGLGKGASTAPPPHSFGVLTALTAQLSPELDHHRAGSPSGKVATDKLMAPKACSNCVSFNGWGAFTSVELLEDSYQPSPSPSPAGAAGSDFPSRLSARRGRIRHCLWR